MKNRAFTFFEVLISLVILGVLLSAISRSYFGNDSIEVYYELQKIKNNYIENKIIVNSDTIQLKQ